MAGPAPIRAAFAARAAAIDGIVKALDYEPAQTRLPEMPCVTMMFVGAEQRDDQTGPAQTVRWVWDVHLWLSFSDGRRAQAELETLVPALLKIVRDDPGLDGTCDFAEWEDTLGTPALGEDDRWLLKTMRLVCRREET